ncbi:MAG: hypothetical protein AAF467_11345 [Actinomycetota bacterium]
MSFRWLALAPVAWLLASCTSDGAVPIDEFQTTTTSDFVHLVDPTDQMRELAEQQCLDDPSLAEGTIEAVDPEDTDVVISSVTVDCTTVRG